MKRLFGFRTHVATLVAANLLFAAAPCLAKNGGKGNGGGKPGGGEDPPSPAAPVTYSIAAMASQGSIYDIYGSNEQAAMVGTVYDEIDGSRGAYAFFPGNSPSVIYLDDPQYNLSPAGWHFQNAVDVNNAGVIVGNIAADPWDTYRSVVITGASTSSPVLNQIPLQDPTSEKEVAVSINDNGDVIVWSEKVVDGNAISRAYVGNVDSNGVAATGSFIEIDDVTQQGFSDVDFWPDRFEITNRGDNGKAIIAGFFRGDGDNYHFRVNHDGSGFEILPDYIAEDGAHFSWEYFGGGPDLNSAGDVAGGAVAYSKGEGKGKQAFFAAVGEYGSDTIVPVGDLGPFETAWNGSRLNDDGDFLLQRGGSTGDALWHGEWSETNGAANIASLIDPNDPNRHLYSRTFDLTNRNGDEWPTILARGHQQMSDGSGQDYWLILTPHLNSAIAAVPEPGSILLLLAAGGVASVGLYSNRRRARTPAPPAIS